MAAKRVGKSRVVARRIEGDLKESMGECLAHFGGLSKVFPREKAVWIKPNAVNFGLEQFTSVNFIETLFAILRDAGVSKIYLADNCTGGNFTRLVYHVAGYSGLCKKYGVEPVMIDEEPTVPITLGEEGRPVQFAKRLYRAWIKEREANVYLAAPKFKTHSMTTLTLSVKGQQGLLQDRDKMCAHNFRLHRRLADIYKFVRPDFVLIDAQKIVYNGHFPAANMIDRNTEALGLLLAGDDALAVDVVGAKIMGYDIEEVEHLRLVKKDGLGEGDLSKIDVIGDISGYKKRYPYEILGLFPENLTRIYGKKMACKEGCRGNSEAAAEYIYNEYGGKGGFNLVCGSGFEPEMFDALEGDFLVVGPCATLEAADIIREKYPRARVFTIDEHNDLSRTTGIMARLMRADIRKMSPAPVLTALKLMYQAWRKGHKSKIAKPF